MTLVLLWQLHRYRLYIWHTEHRFTAESRTRLKLANTAIRTPQKHLTSTKVWPTFDEKRSEIVGGKSAGKRRDEERELAQARASRNRGDWPRTSTSVQSAGTQQAADPSRLHRLLPTNLLLLCSLTHSLTPFPLLCLLPPNDIMYSAEASKALPTLPSEKYQRLL